LLFIYLINQFLSPVWAFGWDAGVKPNRWDLGVLGEKDPGKVSDGRAIPRESTDRDGEVDKSKHQLLGHNDRYLGSLLIYGHLNKQLSK
jgi:hypothetical protein